MSAFLHEFWVFGLKEVRACIFAGSFFLVLALSKLIHIPGLPRYDFILLMALLIQAALLLFRLETWDELKVLCLFHAIGLGLEIFKTQPALHSWSYPEAGYAKILGVPLYSGFMYAAVASYLCQAWRIFHLEIRRYPHHWLSLGLCAAIYLNFFSHHVMVDLRWPLTAAVFLVFGRGWVDFTVIRARRSLPLVLSFFLIGFFIWVAENISTFGGAWVYPNQHGAWHPVSFTKVHSWFLLVIISFVIVADLKHIKALRYPDTIEA